MGSASVRRLECGSLSRWKKKMNHTEARAAVTIAFADILGREGSLPELQCLQAIGWLETNYGASWHGVGVGSYNMGAIQAGPSWHAGTFVYTDTHPNKDGTSTPYQIAFRKYATAAGGFDDLCRVVYTSFDRAERVLPAAGACDLLAFSTELHRAPCYYEGFGATDAERIEHHHAAVVSAIKLQCVELDEAFPDQKELTSVAPALILGAQGDAVKAWQHVIGVHEDGIFGGATQLKTRGWQFAHQLPPSGIVTSAELRTAGLA